MNVRHHLIRSFQAPLLAVGLLLPHQMTAQLDRSTPPPPGPAPIVDLGAHSKFTLPNGLQVIVVENHKLPMVSVQVRFDIPPIAQDEKAGYIDMVSELLTAGAGGRTKAELDDEVDRLGASLHASSTGLYASGLKRNLGPLLDVVRDVIQEPLFPEAEFEKSRTRFRAAVQQRQDDPDSIAEAVGKAAIFGIGHPYGEITTEETLNAITLDAIKAFHRRFFRPGSGYLVFVGDITLKEAEALATSHFGQWNVPPPEGAIENGEEQIPGIGLVRYLRTPATEPVYRKVVIVDRPGASQSLIRVEYPVNLVPKDIRALKAQVMNTILGGGVFNARLMQNLREDKGFTYGAYSSLESDRYNGSFSAQVSVRTEVTAQAVAEILKEMERLRAEPVGQDELELAKRYMAGSFARGLEDPRTVARFALNTALYGLPEDHYATYLKRLEAVTAEDVRSVANVYLRPENAVIFVVGDKERIRRSLIPLSMEPFEPVTELDVDGRPKQDDLVMPPDTTVQQVIEKYIAATGGRQAIAKVKGLKVVCTGNLAKAPVKMTEWFGADGRYRKDVIVDGQLLQQIIFDGRKAVERLSSVSEELTGDRLAELALWNSPVPEVDALQPPAQRTLEGRMAMGGKAVYKVITDHGGPNGTVDLFDASSGLKVRRITTQYNYGQPYTVTMDFSDHRPVAGILLPHTIVQDGGFLGVIELTVSEVVADPSFPEDTFRIKQVVDPE